VNIIWTDKPSNYDTRSITRVWFEKMGVRYTLADDVNYVYSAKLRDVQMILDDAAYALTGRGNR
jgi:hypothetical protein